MTSDLDAAVREIVNTADPIGLLAMGAPEDEYEPEIRDFVERIETGERPSEQVVRAVITRWFGSDKKATDATVTEIAHGLGEVFGGRP